MKKIAVVTDSSSALPSGLLQEFEKTGRFALVPLPVTVAGETLGATADTAERIALAHIQGEQVTTSGPALGALSSVYRGFLEAGFDAVFSVHLSAELSSTVQTARAAASAVDIPVYVIDTRTVAMAQGFVVQQLMYATEHMSDCDLLAEYALDVAENTRLFFYVPTLDALKRGGRIHPALATVGQMFQIRPVASVEDGKLIYIERPRSIARAKESLTAYVKAESERPREDWVAEGELEHPSGRVVAVHYSGNKAEAVRFAEELGAKDAVISPLSDVLAAHTGIGVLAAVTF